MGNNINNIKGNSNNTISLENSIDISIIIVNYNVKDFLFQCLNSIYKSKQDLSLEVFVVDNASTDDSIEYLEPIFPKVNFIKLSKNIGFSRANNIAIKKAIGKYILILNPDTILAEDTLKKMYTYMENNPIIGVAGCKVLNSNGSFQVACRRGFPTPWVSFCKLFGLQRLFPRSKLFARYNQTFRSENESYYIDAVMGAFMFCDAELLHKLNGFDEAYFMYGEDLDLCRRVQLSGRAVAYYSDTSIIHFKGESTKRSSINEVKYFYESMQIFAKKYFSYSTIFLLFLQLGIFLRSIFAKINKYKEDIFLIIFDLIFINISLMIGSYMKFGRFLGFPDYAYPLVFIVISLVYFLSQFFTGAYFENKSSIGKTIFSLLVCFFILSAFTYFFPDYRFSRGALLVTIGSTIFLSSLLRFCITLFQKTFGKYSDKRIIIAGCDDKVIKMINKINEAEPNNINLVGFVSTSQTKKISTGLQVLGEIKDIYSIVEKNKIDEVIITDTNQTFSSLIEFIGNRTSSNKARYHIIPEYDDLVLSRIINEISGHEPIRQYFNISKPRLRVAKRIVDIFVSILALTIGSLLIVFSNNPKVNFINWINVFIGKMSVVGIDDIFNKKFEFGKVGIITISKINNSNSMSESSLEKLAEYYLSHYSLSLDIDIIVKYLVRRIK